jgi:hypothetical protein
MSTERQRQEIKTKRAQKQCFDVRLDLFAAESLDVVGDVV